MFTQPVTDDAERFITKIKVQNGYYHGQTDTQCLSGLGAFMWDSGEFYFGEWDRGIQSVGWESSRGKGSCFSQQEHSSKEPSKMANSTGHVT